MNPSSPGDDSYATRTATVSIEITCPAWCEISADEHAARLWQNEGRCVHRTLVTVKDPAGKRGWEDAPRYCTPIELTLLMTTNPAGREVESADVLVNGLESNLEQLLRLSGAISNLATLYRETPLATADEVVP